MVSMLVCVEVTRQLHVHRMLQVKKHMENQALYVVLKKIACTLLFK
jgi:hypothetical protein